MNMKKLSERDAFTSYRAPLIRVPGLDIRSQVRDGQESNGLRPIVRGRTYARVEQDRIVLRLERLFTLCEQLKRQLADPGESHLRLASLTVDGEFGK